MEEGIRAFVVKAHQPLAGLLPPAKVSKTCDATLRAEPGLTARSFGLHTRMYVLMHACMHACPERGNTSAPGLPLTRHRSPGIDTRKRSRCVLEQTSVL